MFYLNTIEHLFLFVEQLDQLEVCLPYSRLLNGIPILLVFQNLRWNSNKTSLFEVFGFFLFPFRECLIWSRMYIVRPFTGKNDRHREGGKVLIDTNQIWKWEPSCSAKNGLSTFVIRQHKNQTIPLSLDNQLQSMLAVMV